MLTDIQASEFANSADHMGKSLKSKDSGTFRKCDNLNKIGNPTSQQRIQGYLCGKET